MHQCSQGPGDAITIAYFGKSVTDSKSIAGANPERFPGRAHQVSEQPDGGRLSSVASHTDDWNAATLLIGKKHLDNRLAHRSRESNRRIQVHEQARAGIDFHDSSALLLQRLRDVFTNHINATKIQPCCLCGDHHMLSHGRMYIIGYIDGPICKPRHHHSFSISRHGLRVMTLVLQIREDNRVPSRGVDGVPRTRFQVTATGIGVQLQLDQIRHVVHPIAHHDCRITPAGRDHFVADHEKAMVHAADELFHHDVATFFESLMEGLDHLLALGQINENSAPMVRILRLHDDRRSEVLGGGPSIFRVRNDASFRHGHTRCAKSRAREVFVLRDVFSDRSCAVRLRRPNASLLCTLSEKDQTPSFLNATPGDLPLFRRIHDGFRARAQSAAIHDLFQASNGGLDIERLVLVGCRQQITSCPQARLSDGFVLISHHDFVKTRNASVPRFAKTHRVTRQSLKFQGNVLQDVSRVGATLQPLKKASPLADAAAVLDHPGQPGFQTIIEARQFF